MMKRAENESNRKNFYQILMTLAFSLDTGLKYHNVLRLMIYIYIFDWFVMIILAPGSIFYFEKNIELSFVLELIEYILVGVFYVLIYIIVLIKKDAVSSNYNILQTDFIQWSVKKGMDPNEVPRKVKQTIKDLLIPFLSITFSISFGPLISAINEIDKKPLGTRSNFPMFWPLTVEISTLSTYGAIISMQIFWGYVIYVSTLSLNFGFMVFMSELNNQFEILLTSINDAFDKRKEKRFQNLFISCICHHQIIIKFLDDFKSYFKWIILTEIITIQGIFATILYSITKVNAPIGYKVKIIGAFLFNSIPFIYHCHIGEVVLNMHNRLSNQLYEMTWYDMPNEHKQLIVIMYQRTQKDLSLSSALFSSEMASRKLMAKVIKQVYTILNLLLKLN